MKVVILHGHQLYVEDSVAFFFWVSSDVLYFMLCNSVSVVSKYMNYLILHVFAISVLFHRVLQLCSICSLKFVQCRFLPMKCMSNLN